MLQLTLAAILGHRKTIYLAGTNATAKNDFGRDAGGAGPGLLTHQNPVSTDASDSENDHYHLGIRYSFPGTIVASNGQHIATSTVYFLARPSVLM